MKYEVIIPIKNERLFLRYMDEHGVELLDCRFIELILYNLIDPRNRAKYLVTDPKHALMAKLMFG